MSTSTTTISIPASTDLSFAHQVTPSVSDLVTAAMGKGPQAKVAAERLQLYLRDAVTSIRPE